MRITFKSLLFVYTKIQLGITCFDFSPKGKKKKKKSGLLEAYFEFS